MKIVFWQNVLSIHQESLLVELGKYIDVWLIYEQEIYESRKKMGWSIPDFNGIKLISIDTIEDSIEDLLLTISSDYHIFSGINVYKYISVYFNIFYKKNPSRIISFLEKPGSHTIGVKSFFRELKYRFYAKKYKDLKFILTPGGESYFLNVGFKRKKIIPFGYYGPDNVNIENKEKNNIQVIKFIYVGSLIKLKNVSLLINALSKVKSENWILDIIGDGIERISLEKLTSSLNLTGKITFKGYKSNTNTKIYIKNADCLCLPSLYDGWGYVVNEAYSYGCSVICSDACGVSSLVSQSETSSVFKSDIVESLTSCIDKSIEQHTSEQINTLKNITFYKNNLSGECGATKLLNLLAIVKENEQ